MNEIYLSTGAFIGRVNGRDHRLAIEYKDAFAVDGFEWMIYADWYEHLDGIICEYRAAGVKCPAIHADKRIGDLVSDPSDERFEEACALFERNCRAAREVGAQKVVTHLWGLPHSDAHFDHILARCGRLTGIAAKYGVQMLPENIACDGGSPLTHMEALAEAYPDLRFTMDTRPAQFHAEMIETCQSALLTEGRIAHIHINDYAGGYKQWDKLYPIPQPGRGVIDFDYFFAALKRADYRGSITLEAPAMRETGVDVETLSAGIRYIKSKLA